MIDSSTPQVFHGIQVPVITPMTKDQQVDLDALATFCEHLINQGVHALTALGSTGDITRVSTILKLCGDKIKVFCGADTIPVECFMLGAVGWVGGIANVLPRTHVKIYDLAVTQNDLTAAREVFFQAWPALNFIETSGIYTQLVKAGCQIKGHPSGPPRQPLLPVSKEKYAELEKVLQGLD